MFDYLVSQSAQDWQAYTQHDFVRGLGDGSLAKESFQHYLKQDYLFLIQFTRAWGLAVYKSDNFEDMRYGQAGINAMLDTEIQLHIDYCKAWGISEEQLLQEKEASATVAYTRYVLDQGLSGDLLQLHVALSPCLIGYAVIAKGLLAQDFMRLEGNPYLPWIEMYASDAFQAAAQFEMEVLNRLSHDLEPARKQKLAQIFKTATRMEVAFWDMGLQRLM